jgi:hypothetical protein
MAVGLVCCKAVSVLPFGSHVVCDVPQIDIRPAQDIHLVAGEIGAPEKQVGDRSNRVESKSNAHGSIGE